MKKNTTNVKGKNNKISLAGFILMVFISVIFSGFFYDIQAPRRFSVFVMALMLLSCIAGSIYYKKNGNYTGFIFCIFAVGLLSRAHYIIYTPTWCRQHDVIGFGAGMGQAGFIEYFYERLRLIDFDPREKWGFFQPPLHHILAGLWLRLQVALGRFLGWSYDRSCENVQILTMLYSILSVYLGYKILRKFKLEKMPLVFGTLLIACHPCLIQMSGSINNDMLCILLQLLGVYFFLGYMEKEDYGNLIFAAVFMGLSMMAKLSGILLAPGIAIILLYRLWIAAKERKDGGEKFIKYIKQYALFGIISVPLGIWSPVRNLLRFNVPLNFTPKVGESLEEYSLFDRLFSLGSERTCFTCLKAGGRSYDEYNVFLSVLKTSLFGEADFSECSGYSSLVGWILLIAGGVLALVLILMCIGLLLKFKELSYKQEFVFMLVYVLASLGFLYNLIFSIPNFSSEDFRYVAHIIVPEGLCVGLFCNRYKRAAWPVGILVTVFSAASVLTYVLAGFVIWK